jgi:hypothetical protein
MATFKHGLDAFAGTGPLFIAGKVTVTGGTAVLAFVTDPLYQAGDLTVAWTSTGLGTITIAPFRGRQGVATVQLTAETAATVATVTSSTYTNDSLVVTWTVATSSTGSVVDGSFYFQIIGF